MADTDAAVAGTVRAGDVRLQPGNDAGDADDFLPFAQLVRMLPARAVDSVTWSQLMASDYEGAVHGVDSSVLDRGPGG
jgi:hypothetical protein